MGCDKEADISDQETVYRMLMQYQIIFLGGGGNISSKSFMILSHMLNSTLNAK